MEGLIDMSAKTVIKEIIKAKNISQAELAEVDTVIDCSSLLDDKYLLVQRGKKNYYLLIAK